MNDNKHSQELGELYPRAHKVLSSPFLNTSNYKSSILQRHRIIIRSMHNEIVTLKLFTFALLILIGLLVILLK